MSSLGGFEIYLQTICITYHRNIFRGVFKQVTHDVMFLGRRFALDQLTKLAAIFRDQLTGRRLENPP